jgi:hypothetical protein
VIINTKKHLRVLHMYEAYGVKEMSKNVSNHQEQDNICKKLLTCDVHKLKEKDKENGNEVVGLDDMLHTNG